MKISRNSHQSFCQSDYYQQYQYGHFQARNLYSARNIDNKMNQQQQHQHQHQHHHLSTTRSNMSRALDAKVRYPHTSTSIFLVAKANLELEAHGKYVRQSVMLFNIIIMKLCFDQPSLDPKIL